MLTRRDCLSALTALASPAAPLLAQQGQPATSATPNQSPTPGGEPEPTANFSVEVQLIPVGFLVRDGKGGLVTGLNKEQISVREAGKPQTIRTFSREEETPLQVALIIDRSGSQDQFEQENIYAAVTFFRSILRPQDKALVSAFGSRVKLVQDWSASLDDLESGLKRMRQSYDNAPYLGPAIRRNDGSAVLDAIFHTARDKMSRLPGRKAIVMIGDGQDNASKMQLVDLLDFLQNNDILFYGLDNGGKGSENLRNIMPMIAEESGGRVFDTNKISLRKAFEEIELELRTLYTLGYYSSNSARDGKYRKIEIKTHEPSHVVRARPGYYAR